MTFPKYKIQVYKAGESVPLHEFTDEALALRVKYNMTNSIGNFSFKIPAKKGNSWFYHDINLHDLVKIWLGYGSISDSATPSFIGRISDITGEGSDAGYVRVIQGFDLGEVMFRKQRRNTYWLDVDASNGVGTPVYTIATALGAFGAGDLDTVTTNVNLRCDTESYFDLLKKLSDYWFDAGTKIQKDFFIDVDEDLHWKTRPIRSTTETAAAEVSLTYGENILSYEVRRSVEKIRNAIWVYGAADRKNPLDGDTWTESTDDWTPEDAGGGGTVTLDSDSGDYVMGTGSIHGYHPGHAGGWDLILDIAEESLLYAKDPQYIHFWTKVHLASCNENLIVTLYAPDSSNWFRHGILFNPLPDNEWVECKWQTGETTNDITWFINGSPDWSDIEEIKFTTMCPAGGTHDLWIDELYFGGERFHGEASDATSAEAYGQRDMEVIDDMLKSDTDCEKRANALLMQLKDPPVDMTVRTPGNLDIRLGDALSMTIPQENISATAYYVTSLEHVLVADPPAFISTVDLLSSNTVRTAYARNLGDVIAATQKTLSSISGGQVKVR